MGFIVQIIIEVTVVLLIAYGILNEERLIAFEEELFPVLKQWAKRVFKIGNFN